MASSESKPASPFKGGIIWKVATVILAISIVGCLLYVAALPRLSPAVSASVYFKTKIDPPASYVNHTFRIYCILVNPTNEPVELHFQSSYQFDYAILKNSEYLYQWSNGKGSLDAFSHIILFPHDVVIREFEHTSSDYPLAEGTYEIRGFLNPYAGDYHDSVTITVIA